MPGTVPGEMMDGKASVSYSAILGVLVPPQLLAYFVVVCELRVLVLQGL